MLNSAGVSRFSSVSESLTHVIAGQRDDDHWKQLNQLVHKPHVVTAEWVLQSLRLQRAAPESRFIHPDFKFTHQDVFKNPEKPPPLSVSVTQGEQEDSQMMQQYLTNDETETSTDQPNGIFSGLSFQFLKDMDSELVNELNEQIVKNGGKIVSKKASHLVIDAGSQVVPTGFDGRIVSTLWIDDCIENEQIVPVEAYHRQVIVKDNKRMEGCVISSTGLSIFKKEFICRLVTLMGGKPQDTFSKKTNEMRGLLKSKLLNVQLSFVFLFYRNFAILLHHYTF